MAAALDVYVVLADNDATQQRECVVLLTIVACSHACM